MKYKRYFLTSESVTKGHPHMQVMMRSKQRDKINYFIKYNRINKMKDEFTNTAFRDDLLELYDEYYIDCTTGKIIGVDSVK